LAGYVALNKQDGRNYSRLSIFAFTSYFPALLPMAHRYILVWLGSGLLGVGGCSVYVPMQGAAPEIRAKGEAEATASWSLTNRVDFSATYSPLPHLLVRAATSLKGSGRSGSDSASYAQNNQYELAVGTYWPLRKHWLLGGLAGFGQAHAKAQYADDGHTLLHLGAYQPRQHLFDAIYSKYSGEAYATWQPSPAVSMGLSYRLVQLRLTDVTDQGVPVQAAPILRSEPMLYFRFRPTSNDGLLQLQLAIGGSTTFKYNEQTATDKDDPARQFKVGRSYVSLGLAFYPHMLWKKN
jgi:hypothetical protein